MNKYTVTAVDLGASNGRVISGTFSDGMLDLREIHRFANEGISVGERIYTDILHIYHEVVTGLRKACREYEKVDALGIDSWGVDFGLIDGCGELLANPYHYRDGQAAGKIGEAEKIFGKRGLFYETGVQDMWYNTVYQILGIQSRNPQLLQRADAFLMISDILGYLLTGEKNMEYTSASTTQMYSLENRTWSKKILGGIGLREALFPPVLMTGAVKGEVTESAARRIGMPEGKKLPLIATAQHDSAAAAYAVPAGGDFIFINSGTWSIIGMILDRPVITDAIYDRKYSNEGAAFGKVKLIRSIMGMWLIQELRKSWDRKGLCTDYPYLLKKAEEAPPFARHIDPEDGLFTAPSDMEEAVNRYCRKTGQEEIFSQGMFYRSVIESLAFKYREAVADLEDITGKPMDKIYFLGGAVQDTLFCQCIADATGKTVVAGPVEATAVGNIMVQLRALGIVGDEETCARVIRNSFSVREYRPGDQERWNQMYGCYRERIQSEDKSCLTKKGKSRY